jgi:REP element-mobilizing transposase RayT
MPRLADATVASVVREQLLRWAQALEIELSAYTLMPDHAHVLVVDASAIAPTLVRRWKQTTGFRWRQTGSRQPLWQRGFHDRVLRIDESPERVAEYIVMNPVRQGLVNDPADYPFSYPCSGRSSDRP